MPVRLWDVATGKAGHELQKPMKVVEAVQRSGRSDHRREAGEHSCEATKSMDGRAFSPGRAAAASTGRRIRSSPAG